MAQWLWVNIRWNQTMTHQGQGGSNFVQLEKSYCSDCILLHAKDTPLTENSQASQHSIITALRLFWNSFVLDMANLKSGRRQDGNHCLSLSNLPSILQNSAKYSHPPGNFILLLVKECFTSIFVDIFVICVYGQGFCLRPWEHTVIEKSFYIKST